MRANKVSLSKGPLKYGVRPRARGTSPDPCKPHTHLRQGLNATPTVPCVFLCPPENVRTVLQAWTHISWTDSAEKAVACSVTP